MNEVTPAPEEKKSGARSEVYDWLQSIVAALLICVLVFVFLVRIISVVGSSMVPTLQDGDKVFMSNLFYTPRQGDIVVLTKESFGDEPLVKRIIATEGQTIDIDFDEGVVYVDGVALDEPYTAEPTYTREDFSGPMVVPEGCVFVMGDNRNASTDSRHRQISMVDERCILGKVYFVLLPFSNFGSVY